MHLDSPTKYKQLFKATITLHMLALRCTFAGEEIKRLTLLRDLSVLAIHPREIYSPASMQATHARVVKSKVVTQ